LIAVITTTDAAATNWPALMLQVPHGMAMLISTRLVPSAGTK